MLRYGEHPTMDNNWILNAKSQSREGAKSFFHPGVLAFASGVRAGGMK